jgi:hypothetical protein
MKTVNLLPEWYLQQQRQSKNLRVHLGIMILLGLGMVAATVVARGRIAALTVRRDALARHVAQDGDPDQQLQTRQTELKRLENLQLAYRELGNTIPMSAVIQQVQNDMTLGMALSRVTIDVRSEPVKGSGLIGDIRHPPHNHNIAYLVVVGVAPNDVQIAQLIGKVSSNPLFSDVALNYTHTELLNDHSIRRFEIQMEMELERLATEDARPADGSPALRADSTGGHDNAG